MTNKAIILINEDASGVSVTTNGVTVVTMLHCIDTLKNYFCDQLYQQAQGVVGENSDAINEYIETQLAEYKQRVDNKIPLNLNQN